MVIPKLEDVEPDRSTTIPNDPTAKFGFEITPPDKTWSFAPTYYPDRFPQTKERDLKRDGSQCGGEDVELEQLKNREFHVSGILLSWELDVFQRLMDWDDTVDLITPISQTGGFECHIKSIELGDKAGWDPEWRNWQFEYSIDLVSTGRDESDNDGQNAIVSSILES